MKFNMGKNDRIIRLILGLVIIVVGIYYKSWWSLIGLIPLGTAAIGYCPLYNIFNISTIGKK